MFDGIANLVSGHKIPIGDWLASIVNAINGTDFIDAVSNGIAAASTASLMS